MLNDSQFRTVRILYCVIGCLLLLGGVFLMVSGHAASQAESVLMILFAVILFFEVRLSNVERRLRRVENKIG